MIFPYIYYTILIMKEYNIKRDDLDYILTDTLPVELSELYTNIYFYEFLHSRKTEIDEISDEFKKLIFSFSTKNPFMKNNSDNHGIPTIPLTFNILKSDQENKRKMSIPQPLSALEIYFFIRHYQTDILLSLKKSRYSIRYHTRNNSLNYKTRHRKPLLIDYRYSCSKKNKKFLEQSGSFFNIGPVSRINHLTSCEEWVLHNLKYKFYCKLDYKRCFDSIYTHSFKWIVTDNTVDSKNFNNSSLFAAIDRILQNINGYSSNGIIVGPEFSRLIAEILLQEIDNEVFYDLQNNNIKLNEDYVLLRYVDDMFLFTNSEDIQNKIIEVIDAKSKKYLLELNEHKIEKSQTPYLGNAWVFDMQRFANSCDQLLFNGNQTFSFGDDIYQLNLNQKNIESIRETFMYIISKNHDFISPITSYAMSVLLNNMSRKKKEYAFFRRGSSDKTVCKFLDLVFFIYSHCINFYNTQKLVSIMYYCHNEISLIGSKYLQDIINKYDFSISNSSEIVNLFVALRGFNVSFRTKIEGKILDNILESDNPILLATFLYYSQYNDRYLDEISSVVNNILNKKLNYLNNKNEILLLREFWYIIIFNKCPYVSEENKKLIEDILKIILKKNSKNRNIKLFIDFMLDKNQRYCFFSWRKKGIKFMQEITYRTSSMTVFKRKGLPLLTSI